QLEQRDRSRRLTAADFAQRKRPAGVTPPTLSCNCRLAGPVPLLCIPVARTILISSTRCRLTPLRIGIAEAYRGRLTLSKRMEPTIHWFRAVVVVGYITTGASG